MSASLHRLHPRIAVEVQGVDIAQSLDDDTVSLLREALARYGVLVFRLQHCNDDELVAFGRRFGALELLPEPEKREERHPEIFNLSNVLDSGAVTSFDEPQAVFLRGTERWHTDSSYREVPCLASMLLAQQLPATGGETQFANMYEAYNALSAEQQQAYSKLRVIHSYEYSRANNPGRMAPMNDAERAKYPPVEHPLVRTHATGKKSLYLGAHASHIVGMAPEAGRTMLAELLELATQERFVYEHHWQVDDLVIWDNRCTLHRLRPYDIAKEPRVMRRITVAGDGPVA